MKNCKLIQIITGFIKKYSKAFIALVVAFSLLLSVSGISSIIALIRSARQTETGDVTAPTTIATEPAETLSKQEQMEQAVTYLNTAIAEDPENPELFTQRAALLYNLGKTEDALADYTAALVLKDDPATRYLRAIVHTTIAENQAAYEDLTAALHADPDNKDYLSLMADVCNTLQRYDQALECLNKLLVTDPDNCVLRTLAGDACVYGEDFETAVVHYEKAIACYTDANAQSGISKASLYSAYGNALKTLNRFAEAADAYSRSLELEENKELYFQQGFCLLQSENYTDAATAFTKCIELEYETGPAHFQRALCYYAKGNYNKAAADFKVYEKAFPEKTDAYLYMGLCYQNMGRYKDAISYYQKCIKAGISTDNCNFNIGNCYYNQKEYSKAVGYYDKSIKAKVYLYESLLNRGVCYIQLNKYNEAKADLKRVIDECKNKDLVKSATKSYDPIKNITIITKQ